MIDHVKAVLEVRDYLRSKVIPKEEGILGAIALDVISAEVVRIVTSNLSGE